MKVVATGGLAPLLAEGTGVIERIDADSRLRDSVCWRTATQPPFWRKRPHAIPARAGPATGPARSWKAQARKGWGEVRATMP